MKRNYIQNAIRLLIISFFAWLLGLFAALGAIALGWVAKDPALYAMLAWSGAYAVFVISVQLITGARFWKDYGNMRWEK